MFLQTMAVAFPRPRAARIAAGRLALTVGLFLLAVVASARADEVPGEFAFAAPPGWTVSSEARDALAKAAVVKQAFAYTDGSGTVFGVMLFTYRDPAKVSAREAINDFQRGMLDGTTTPVNVTHAETATTAEMSFEGTSAVTVHQRCLSWMGTDRTLHTVCGLCIGTGALDDACRAAQSSLKITAPLDARLPLGSPGDVPKGRNDAPAYKAGRIVGWLAVPVGLIILVIYLTTRRSQP